MGTALGGAGSETFEFLRAAAAFSLIVLPSSGDPETALAISSGAAPAMSSRVRKPYL